MNIFDLLIVQPIFNLLIGIYSLIPGGDFGISLIIFTILVRFAMWPLVKRQLHQVKAMRKIQPELKKIKAKTKGNRQAESMAMLELYKKHGVSPFRTIGILLIQLPIFFAIYRVVQIFTLSRDEIGKYTYGFMDQIGPIKDLIANPSTFNEKLLGFVDLTKHAISGQGVIIALVVLAIIAAALQYVMTRQTSPHDPGAPKRRLRDVMSEAAEGKNADQSEMNAIVSGKMMKVLPFLMLFIMLNLPGAIVLYYTVSNLVAVLQQGYILRKDKEELEAIASEKSTSTNGSGKKATAKAREKQAVEARVTGSSKTTTKITRITAKDTTRKAK